MTRGLHRHPRYRTLSRFADGELAGRALARTTAHLAGCARCREEVAFIRRVADHARSLSAPPVADDLLERTASRWARGDRMLLPAAELSPAPHRRLPMWAAALAMGVLVVAAALVTTRVLEADRPALRITPERPVAGASLTLRYDGGLFDGESRLAVRARYRTRWNGGWTVTAGVLTRGDDGAFHGSVELPDSAVYAAFAVEDPRGERVDTNHRKLWDVVVHDAAGRPTFAGLSARSSDLIQRSWGEATATAREMTRLYPDEPWAWNARFAFDASQFDADSVFAFHRSQYQRLSSRVTAQNGDALAGLSMYAASLGQIRDAVTLLDEARSSGAPAQALSATTTWLVNLRPDLARNRRLAALDTAWRLAPRVNTAQVGLANAIPTTDTVLVETWLDRLRAVDPSEPGILYLENAAAQFDPLVVDRWARESASWLDRTIEQDRPLELTPAEHRRDRQELSQRLLVFLGETAFAAGQPIRARSLASRAVPLSWNTDALLRAGRVLEAVGDTADALNAFARAAADPSSDIPSSARGDDTLWDDRATSARRELDHHVLEGAIMRHLPDPIMVRLGDLELDLRDLVAGGIAVVAFVSRYSRPSLDQLETLAVLDRQLRQLDARVVVVEIDEARAVDAMLDRAGLSLVVVWDREGEARAAFQSAQIPDYFVLDAQGRVRFEHSTLARLRRQLGALRDTASSAVAD